MSYPPLRDCALIGDCHAAALVSCDGSIDWCCFHRFDGRPVFTRLLDWKKGGYFRVAPTGRYTTSRRYVPGTNVLETTFDTGSGRLVVTDCLPVRPSSVFCRSRSPRNGEFLGNFPQAFSHVGLIGAALNLEKGRRIRESTSHAT